MTEAINKIKTYLGFSIKSNTLTFGYDNITKSRKKFDLVIFCESANEKIISDIIKIKDNCVKLKGVTLEELLSRKNVKVVAIKNYSLVKAILKYDNLFEHISKEVK